MIKVRLLLPREHGGWGMLLMPFLAGWGIAGLGGVRVGVALAAVFFLYLARYPLFLWARGQGRGFAPQWRNWFLIYLSLGVLLGGWLVLAHELWLLLPLGAVALLFFLSHLYLGNKHQERSVAGEFLGIAGLSLSAPVAVYASSGRLGDMAFWLWFLALAYFATSIFYVKMKVEEFSPKGGANSPARRRLARFLAWYQAGAIVAVLVLSFLKLLPPLTVLAFLPVTIQVVWGLFKPVKQLNIKKLGWSQVGQSALFFLLLVLAYRWTFG